MFYERLQMLCSECGEKITNVILLLGMGSGNLSSWKSGNTPKGDTLIKLAEHFKVSTDYLLGRTDIKEMARLSDDALNPEERKLLELYHALPDDIARGQVFGYIERLLEEAPASVSSGEKAV